MNKIEKIIGAQKYQEIKKFLFGEETEKKEEEEVKMAQATLEDGTIIEIDGELAENVAVFVVTEEGNVEAPDDTHVLSDGTKVTTVNGIVTAIERAGEEAPEVMAAVEALEQTIQEYQKQVDKMKADQAKFNKDIFEALEAFAGGKVESKKDKFGKADVNMVSNRIDAIKERLSKKLNK
jgi:hypothetical protein